MFNLQLFEIKKLSRVRNTLSLLMVGFYTSPSEAPDADWTQCGDLKRLWDWGSERGIMFLFRSQSWGKSRHKTGANWAQKSSLHVHTAEHKPTVDDQFGDVSSHVCSFLHRRRGAPLLTPLRMQKQRLLHCGKLPCTHFFVHVVVQLLYYLWSHCVMTDPALGRYLSPYTYIWAPSFTSYGNTYLQY